MGQLREVAVLCMLDIHAGISSIFSKHCYDNVVGAWLHLENPEIRKKVAGVYEEDVMLFLLSGGSKTTRLHPSLLPDNL